MDRFESKIPEDEFRLVLEIMSLGMVVSKNTKYRVSVEYAGHVHTLCVRVLVGPVRDVVKSFRNYLGEDYSVSDSLVEMRDYLLGLLVDLP